MLINLLKFNKLSTNLVMKSKYQLYYCLLSFQQQITARANYTNKPQTISIIIITVVKYLFTFIKWPMNYK